ncbi:hypothetical protein [Dactylosporangium matsuzakiense]|uniref:Uncharacterized protein n=1 Tax=Dactylosporangium matsuzakiense TaxID=53360 RepID=A0A9W6KVG1_9ACTN|nr:hypothetical protein [Dactylosporangium matsuzakiense]UWZ49147.1 hypothetical protein Dmats_23785 [Dactylosporangium matsuzakiense]GLL08408.1 hypothetical protein GCM10017581_101690 [Dactylosporangium matsuzakiense]
MIGVVGTGSGLVLLGVALYLVLRGEELFGPRWHRFFNPEEWQTEVEEAEAGPGGPVGAAGACTDAGALVAELERAYAAYRRGEDVFAGAAREPGAR